MDDEIELAVKRLRNNRSGGPLGMRAEHLKGWLAEPRKEEAAAEEAKEVEAGEGAGEAIIIPGGGEPEEKRDTETNEITHWDNVVALVRASLGEGRLAEEYKW